MQLHLHTPANPNSPNERTYCPNKGFAFVAKTMMQPINVMARVIHKLTLPCKPQRQRQSISVHENGYRSYGMRKPQQTPQVIDTLMISLNCQTEFFTREKGGQRSAPRGMGHDAPSRSITFGTLSVRRLCGETCARVRTAEGGWMHAHTSCQETSPHHHVWFQ